MAESPREPTSTGAPTWQQLADVVRGVESKDIEITRLQAELAAARAQIEGRVTIAEEIQRRHDAVESLASELSKARAQIAAMQAVVDAAVAFDSALEEFGFEPAYVADSYQPLHDALAALSSAEGRS